MATSGARTTPAGMPVLRFQVQHTSMQQEAGKTRPVEVEAELVAYGKVAQELAQVFASKQTGEKLRFTGFIDRKGIRNPQLELHVTGFEHITELGIPAPV
jgi:primosomal replication protein N